MRWRKLQAVKHEDNSDTKLTLPPCIFSHSIFLPVCARMCLYIWPRSHALLPLSGAQLRLNLSNPEYWQHKQSVPPWRTPASPLTAFIVSRKTRDRQPMQTWATLKKLKIHLFFFFPPLPSKATYSTGDIFTLRVVFTFQRGPKSVQCASDDRQSLRSSEPSLRAWSMQICHFKRANRACVQQICFQLASLISLYLYCCRSFMSLCEQASTISYWTERYRPHGR